MTEQHARATANVVMAAAALGAAVIVLRSPTLRRLAWRLATQYVAGPLVVSAVAIARQAWDEAGPTRIGT
jgi:hypothetical protein